MKHPNIDLLIAKLLAGCDAHLVISEDLAKTACHYASTQMLWDKIGKDSAMKKAKDTIGYQPDEDILHMATEPFEKLRKEKVSVHHVKQSKKNR